MKAIQFPCALAALSVVAAFSSVPAQAVSTSYYLDQSNIKFSPRRYQLSESRYHQHGSWNRKLLRHPRVRLHATFELWHTGIRIQFFRRQPECHHNG